MVDVFWAIVIEMELWLNNHAIIAVLSFAVIYLHLLVLNIRECWVFPSLPSIEFFMGP